MGSSYDIGVLPNLYGYVLLIIWFASVDSVPVTIISTAPTKVAMMGTTHRMVAEVAPTAPHST